MKGKVTPEKAKILASRVVAVLFQRAIDMNELEEDFSEADNRLGIK